MKQARGWAGRVSRTKTDDLKRYRELVEIAAGLAASIKNAYWAATLCTPTLNMQHYSARFQSWLMEGVK